METTEALGAKPGFRTVASRLNEVTRSWITGASELGVAV
jgi:hypothetical protein